MAIESLCIQFKREDISFRIKRKRLPCEAKPELELRLTISLQITSQSGQELSLKNSQFVIRVL